MTTYILVVDDEPTVLETVTAALQRDGFEVGQAISGAEAYDYITERRPDAVLLDVMMPEMDGLTLCRQLRADTRYVNLPILFLTARTEIEDIVAGLDAGGDDYVVKPFKVEELRARVRALLRRSQQVDDQDQTMVVEVGGLKLDSSIVQVFVRDESVQLTATEHRLLRYLMEHANQPISPQHLLEAVWDYPPETGDPDLVRTHVRNLRAKIEMDTGNPRFLRTVHGIGYMIQD